MPQQSAPAGAMHMVHRQGTWHLQACFFILLNRNLSALAAPVTVTQSKMIYGKMYVLLSGIFIKLEIKKFVYELTLFNVTKMKLKRVT